MTSQGTGMDNAIPVELAREIARQGETRLDALLDLGTAADIRATTLCGIFGAAAVGVGAAVLSVLASEHPSESLVLAGAIVAVGLFASAIISGFAGAPRDFYLGGGSPDRLRQWSWHGEGWRTEVEMLDASGVRYADSIAENDRRLRAAARLIHISLIAALASPILGVGAFFLAHCGR